MVLHGPLRNLQSSAINSIGWANNNLLQFQNRLNNIWVSSPGLSLDVTLYVVSIGEIKIFRARLG